MATKPPPLGKAPAIDPAARAHGPTAVTPAAEVARLDQATATAAVAATTETAPVKAAGAVGRAAGADRIANIADRLRRGLLTPNQAVEELIADTVKHSLPGVAIDSRLGDELRALLNAYVKEDPLLAAKIGRLGVDP
ncbi:MAG TPA: hypothetical protein PLW65_29860 [Pseudomonadota bacterium]|nr:hypothetical protein [Pseudomonadota bacterium]